MKKDDPARVGQQSWQEYPSSFSMDIFDRAEIGQVVSNGPVARVEEQRTEYLLSVALEDSVKKPRDALGVSATHALVGVGLLPFPNQPQPVSRNRLQDVITNFFELEELVVIHGEPPAYRSL